MKANKTLKEALQYGKERLKEAERENATAEAGWLLSEATGFLKQDFYLKEDILLTDAQEDAYTAMISERASGRPFQYIIGNAPFFGFDFFVGDGVLIPRFDTEILVETVLEVSKRENLKKIADIGTGSGCIPISLAMMANLDMTGLDISEKALSYAQENNKRHQTNVRFIKSDCFSALPKAEAGSFDALVSNPPYIPKGDIEGLMEEVRRFEPHNALDGGVDGLDFYRLIVSESSKWLKHKGWLFFEIGFDQGLAVSGLMKEAGFCDLEIRKDLEGHDRVVMGKTDRE